MAETIEQRLSGGHPNSLGNTVAVAEDVLRDESENLMNELCQTYQSTDEVVRLRVSSALKRVCGLHRESISADISPRPDWILKRFDWLIDDIGWNLNQPSAKWTIAQITLALESKLSADQRQKAIKLLKHNLETEPDWIVQNMTAETLAHFAQKDEALRSWLIPKLKIMQTDSRKSVASRARKLTLSLKA